MKIFFLIMLLPLVLFAKIKIATTTTDLEALVQAVGQDQVEVFSIAKGTQDAHQIEAKPSFMVKLREVQLVIAHGLDLESAWLKALIQGARNNNLNAPGAILEIAQYLNPIEIMTEKTSRADGDIHPGGNPHFQLDPIRLGQAAVVISKKLSDLDGKNKDFYIQNAEVFKNSMDQKTKKWQERIKKTGINEIVTFHKTFSYFCDRFLLKCDIQLEPKPGIPPTASHLISIIKKIQENKIKLVMIENLYDDSAADKLKDKIPEIKVVKVPVSVGGEIEIKNNTDLIEKIVQTIEKVSP